MKYTNTKLKIIVTITFILFILFLFWGLWFKFNDNTSIVENYKFLITMSLKERLLYDIIPFQYRFDVRNQVIIALLNAVIFMPIGVLLNIIFEKKNILRDVLICFGISLTIEIIQLFTLIGSFSTSDLIMNTLGYFIGLPFYYLLFKKETVKFNSLFFIIVNSCLSVILLFGLINTIYSLDVIIKVLTKTV